MKVGVATVTGIASDSVSPDSTVEAKNSIVYEVLDEDRYLIRPELELIRASHPCASPNSFEINCSPVGG